MFNIQRLDRGHDHYTLTLTHAVRATVYVVGAMVKWAVPRRERQGHRKGVIDSAHSKLQRLLKSGSHWQISTFRNKVMTTHIDPA